MRSKDFNTGLRGVLFEARHYERMGSAVWLYAWLVLRQTHQIGTTGWVLGGAPIRYEEIKEETGFNARTLERWMRILRRHGYIETQSVPGGIVVRITKAKKHASSTANPGRFRRVEMLHRAAAGIRKAAEDPRNSAHRNPQNCVAVSGEHAENKGDRTPIGSSFLEESIERFEAPQPSQETSWPANRRWNPAEFRNQPKNQSPFERLNPSCSGQSPNQNQAFDCGRDPFGSPGRFPREQIQAPQTARLTRDEVRLQLELLRAEREEAVRRELRVGRGPEPCRSVPNEGATAASAGESE